MPDFAIVQNGTVVNVIVAHDQTSAESLTGMNAVPTDGKPWIGWTLESQGWKANEPPPYASWAWDFDLLEYAPPIAEPDPVDGGDWVWDEDALNWVLVESPQ